jgi:hypothetical protein
LDFYRESTTYGKNPNQPGQLVSGVTIYPSRQSQKTRVNIGEARISIQTNSPVRPGFDQNPNQRASCKIPTLDVGMGIFSSGRAL